jgi:4-diphosphocytidyl-2-C-methyl-D-erythritol kinase
LTHLMIHEPAPAKINLYLHVVGQRADGYHELDSLAVFPGASDHISAFPADGFSLDITGPFAAALSEGADNLVQRAASVLAEWSGRRMAGARLLLNKQLPVASGIGGGSADAAATLRLLTRLWNLPISAETLLSLAAKLGADVPVCLRSSPARMRGIGDRLETAPVLPNFAMVLVNPGIAVATADVFRARSGEYSPPARLPDTWPDVAAMARDLSQMSNDLEPAATQLCPIIAEVLAALRSQTACLLARMSGSGGTCFGIFPRESAARSAAAELTRSGWWCWVGAC